MNTLNRRDLLASLALGTASGTVPLFLQRAAAAEAPKPKSIPGFRDDRVLVVVQLSGGNDGLNTVVPYADDRYYQARPNLALKREDVLKLNDSLGLHPQMAKLCHVYEHGKLAVLQGVGYPNPNRSHFRSLEIWHTASPAEKSWTTGWLGRYFDHECRGAQAPIAGLNLGERLPLALAAERYRAICVDNPALFGWKPLSPGAAAEAEARAFARINTPRPAGAGETLDFLARTASDARLVGRELDEALTRYRSAVAYPEFRFSQSLKLVAQMISAELPTRLYYVELGGFDTHATQANRHAALLQELSEGLGAFLHDLHQQGHLDRTLVMTFSEFGRRVAENRSGGTDHGAGSMMLLAGGNVTPGVHGRQPDLADLDSGDLKHQLDFRSVFATVLKGWLGTDPAPILQGQFPTLPLFRS